MHNYLKQFSLLIVDDDKLVQRLAYDVLLRLGFGQIYRASDGEQAIEFLAMHTIDFIICDWRMPGMDGIELIRQIRRAATSANPLIPIIMLTGNAEHHHVVHARDIGANEYLVKPFTVKELSRRIIEVVDHPREFIIAKSYKGPSRRRVKVITPKIDRRQSRVKPIKVGHVRRK